MLIFNPSGLLVPDHIIVSTIQEFEQEFVSNISTVKRRALFHSFVKYNEDFKKVCKLKELHQWMDGACVPKKENPVDFDLVTFLDVDISRDLGI